MTRTAPVENTINTEEEELTHTRTNPLTHSINLFPNPAVDFVNVDLTPYEGRSVTLQVQDYLGRVILQRDIETVDTYPIRLDLDNPSNGMYHVSVHSKGLPPQSVKFLVARR